MSNMEVRVDVGENDIVKVNIGDSADVEIEAYNNRKFKGIVTQIASSTTKTGTATSIASGDVTNYEVRIRLVPSSYSDLIDRARPNKFPFRPGMNASADIKTKRKDNVVAVPISAVGTRLKGSDKSMDEQKKENEKEGNDENETTVIAGDELEIVVFVLTADNKVEKRVITTGIQDMNYYEVLTGLKEGEVVVTAPYDAVTKDLKPGDEVKVVTKEKLY